MMKLWRQKTQAALGQFINNYVFDKKAKNELKKKTQLNGTQLFKIAAKIE